MDILSWRLQGFLENQFAFHAPVVPIICTPHDKIHSRAVHIED